MVSIIRGSAALALFICGIAAPIAIAAAEDKGQCFCLINNNLPSAVKREATHKGCTRVSIPNRQTKGVNCISDADGSPYPIDFETDDEFQRKFEEIAEGKPKCTPCIPVIKGASRSDNPRGDD